jgi:hypothetical protein
MKLSSNWPWPGAWTGRRGETRQETFLERFMSKSGAGRLWVETPSNPTFCLIGIILYFAERIHPRQAGGLAFVVDRAVGETPCGLI